MEQADAVIAVFADHQAAEAAIKKLTTAGFEMKNLSVVGKARAACSGVAAGLAGRFGPLVSPDPCRSRVR